jgi:hypothetical protein
MKETYRLNEPSVACEVMEGDLILLHFDSGFYYSVQGTGAAICRHLLAGGTISAAVARLAAHYGIPAEQVRREAGAFVAHLVKEGLLVPAAMGSDGRTMAAPVGAYEAPRCEKFEDMADQLLLDKIDDLSQDVQWAPRPPDPM